MVLQELVDFYIKLISLFIVIIIIANFFDSLTDYKSNHIYIEKYRTKRKNIERFGVAKKIKSNLYFWLKILKKEKYYFILLIFQTSMRK